MRSNLQLIMDDEITRFEEEVRRLTNQGYQLYGQRWTTKSPAKAISPTINAPSTEPVKTVYVQAMIKP